MLSDARLDRLKSRAEAADAFRIRYDSRWVVDYNPDGEYPILVLDSHNGGHDGSLIASVVDEHDAQFVAAADPTMVLALLADIEELRAQRERAVAAITGAIHGPSMTVDARAALVGVLAALGVTE